MTNPYFDAFDRLPRDQLARAEAVNAIFDLVVVAFDSIPSVEALQQDRISFSDETGAANAYLLTPAFDVASYESGSKFSFIATHDNTGAATINVNGLGVKAIVRPDGSPVVAGDIRNGRIIAVQYDGAAFQMMSATSNEAGAIALLADAAASAADAAAAAQAVVDAANVFDASLYMKTANNGSDIANKTTFRTTIGLGTAAEIDVVISNLDPSGTPTKKTLWIKV